MLLGDILELGAAVLWVLRPFTSRGTLPGECTPFTHSSTSSFFPYPSFSSVCFCLKINGS